MKISILCDNCKRPFYIPEEEQDNNYILCPFCKKDFEDPVDLDHYDKISQDNYD